MHHEKQPVQVGCDVRHCLFHSRTDNRCEAAHIEVQNRHALTKDETCCATFIPNAQRESV